MIRHMRNRITTVLFAIVALVAAAGEARAQGALVHGTVAAALSGDTTSPAFGGGVTWRFNRALGLGVELSHLPGLEPQFAHIYCCGRGEDETRATVFSTNVRLEIPTVSRRVIPFVIAGGGVAGITESYDVWYAALANTIDRGAVRTGQIRLMAPSTILPGPSEVEVTSTSMALTLGGGASLMLTDRFAVDIDLRVLHLMRDEGRNIGRFGAGLSYRF